MPPRPPGQSCPARRLIVLGAWLVLLAPAAAVLPACASDERDPNQPLNADEGAALLHEIRDDPGRMRTLTPQERQYLMRTLKK